MNPKTIISESMAKLNLKTEPKSSSTKHEAWLKAYRDKHKQKIEKRQSASLEYVQVEKSPAPKVKDCATKSTGRSVQYGSVAKAKQTAIKQYVHKCVDSSLEQRSRAKDKLRTKLRQFDRHKKEFLQYQSGMDWVIAQKGKLFDLLMFAVSICLHKSVKANIPFALSLISHYVPQDYITEAQHYFQALCSEYLYQSSDDIESDNMEPATMTKDGPLNDWFARYKKSDVWMNVKKLYVYLTCVITHGPAKCRERDIVKLMKDNLLTQIETSGDLIINIISLTRKLFTNFHQCVVTGNWSDIFHCESTYEKWYNDNLEVERRFAERMIPNDSHSLIAKTQLLLKQGKEMLSQMRLTHAPRSEMLAVNSRYLKTYDLYIRFMGGVAATQLRRLPFCLLVTGKSKIGKTSFLKVNEALYAHLFNKEKNVESYVRQSADRFWDAYQANQWSIIFDDVCAHNPNQVQGIDEFHKDVLHIVNNVPKMAECAALEDKGTKPVMVDLMQITSNVRDLHAGVYFHDTAALFRRLQFRVTLKLKPEYMGDEGFIDPTKIPVCTGYPDLWLISIQKAITTPYGHDRDREQGSWIDVKGMQDVPMWSYLQWFKQVTAEHVVDQNKFLENMQVLKDTSMCEKCGLPEINHPGGVPCGGIQFQSDIEDVPILEEIPDAPASVNDPPLLPAETQQKFFEWDNLLGLSLKTISKMMDAAWHVRSSKHKAVASHLFWYMSNVMNYFVLRWAWWLATSFHPLVSLPLTIIFWLVTHPAQYLGLFGFHLQSMVVSTLFYNFKTMIADKLADTAALVTLAGKRVFKSLNGSNEILTIVATLTTGLVVLYALMRTFLGNKKINEEEVRHDRTIYQGQMVSNMKHGNEPENVWRMHDYKCEIFDVPLPSSSLKNADEMTIVSYFHRFLVRLKIRWNVDNGQIYRVTGGTGILLGGQKILFPTHFFDKPRGALSLHSVVVLSSTRRNNTREYTCVVDKFSREVFDEQMSILTFPSMPAQRAIQATVPTKDMLNFIGPALRIGRGKQGEVFVDRIKRIHNVKMAYGNHWHTGEGDDAITQLGDCGSLLIAMSPSGPVLVGVHLWLDCYDEDNKISIAYNFCGKKFESLISDAPPQLVNLEKVGELGPLHSKSPIQYLDDLGGMQVFGSFSGFRTSVKSHVTETIGASFLKERYGFVHTHGPPVMAGREVKFLHLQSFRRSNALVSEYQAELACTILLQHVLEHSDDWTAYQITQHDAVNGVPGVRFIDRIPMTTSCGFPYKTPKYNKIRPVIEGDWTSTLVVDEDIQADIDFVLDRWRQKKRACPVFTAALKDEARKFSKIKSKSTRIFYGGPAGLIIAERMVFTWFTRLVQTNPLVFMQAPGMDATGSQWDLLYRWMNQSDNWIAGDFKEFDISMIIQFLRMSYRFIILLAKHLEAEPEHIAMMEAASEDLINPLVDYFGDLIMGTGKNPSGHALTVIINGLVNAFYMIHCYLVLNPEVDTNYRWDTLRKGEDFFRDVRAMFYGDDNILNVSPRASWFNHTAISLYLKSVGVTYTMAEKDRESVPYIGGDEITFLKRSFRYEPEVEGYVAPLDITSVHKALMLTIPSKVVSKEKAYCDCIVSQNDTMWHHGKEEFERFQLLLNSLIEHLDLGEYMVRPLLTYDELSARWLSTRKNLENSAWKVDTTRYLFQSDLTEESVDPHSCQRCGQCPYMDLEGLEYEPCRLCGGCTFGGDPWCINCQEDGFCSCGDLFDFSIMVNRRSLTVTILLACDECDNFKLKSVPLTRIVANSHGIPWSTVTHT